jgi:(R,R)-butanediol dehydrogenase/meso-butanediol dehydrogenase/diacetyl reductase
VKAAIIKGKKRIECEEVPKPTVEPGTLLLKTRYASICGSDLEYLDGTLESRMDQGPHAGSLAVQLWREVATLRTGGILGHEYIAEVAEVGEGISGWQVGQRVVPRGQNLDEGYGANGCMCEYFLRTPEYVLPALENVADEEAALVEPMSVSIGAVNWAELKATDSLVIIGIGKIGLLALLYAKVIGVCPIIAIDINASRLEKAAEIGADIVLNAKEVDVVSEVLKITEGGADAVIPCVREGKVLNQAVEMVKMYGIIPIAGFIPPTEVDPALWLVKEIRLLSFRSGPPWQKNPMTTAMRMMANKQVDVKPLITAIMPLDEVQKGFDSVYNGENIAVLLNPSV